MLLQGILRYKKVGTVPHSLVPLWFSLHSSSPPVALSHGQPLVLKYKELLDLISKNHLLITGDPANSLDYLTKRWAVHLVAPTPPASSTTGRKRPHSATTPGSNSASKTPTTGFHAQNAAPGTSHAISNAAPCPHILCKTLGLKHTNGACLRKSNREAWQALLAQNQSLVDKLKREDKWPKAFAKAPTPAMTPAVSAISITRPTKKQKQVRVVAPAVAAAAVAATATTGAGEKRGINPDAPVEQREEMTYDLNAMNQAANYCKSTFSEPNPALQTCAINSSTDSDNRLIVPVEIQGHRFKALIDPGATASFLDRATALSLQIPIKEYPEASVDLVNGSKCSMAISINSVDFILNGRNLSFSVAVMPLKGYEFLLGMDMFNKFGYFIGGVSNPVLGPSAFYEELLIEHDTPPEMVGIERPAEEQTEEFKSMRTDFLASIQPYLDENASIDPKSFCPHPLMEVNLSVPPGTNVYQKPHSPFPYSERAGVQKQLDQWLEDGIIVPTNHTVVHTNQLTLSARRDLEGRILKTRLCLDPRNLNSHLLDCDKFPLPRIDKIINDAAGHKYFTTLDLRSAFLRSPLTKKSQPLTAFYYNGKQYMFQRAPFGLKPMTSIFQRGMMAILGDLDFVAVYVDDIVIYSKTAEEHQIHVQEVLKRLTQNNLIVNAEKCHFFCTEIVQ